MALETLQTFGFPSKIGGHIALDFTNTAEHRGSEQFRDSLHTFDRWLAWCWQSNLISDHSTTALFQIAAQHPELARQNHQLALTLREAIYQIFSAASRAEDWRTIDLTPLNEMLRQGYPHRQLLADSSGISWGWDAHDNLDQPLWQLAHVAAELLTSEQVTKVRQCPNCGWLFIDSSRNGMRRWCSMEYCGSQVKSRRQYERKKAAHDQ